MYHAWNESSTWLFSPSPGISEAAMPIATGSLNYRMKLLKGEAAAKKVLIDLEKGGNLKKLSKRGLFHRMLNDDETMEDEARKEQLMKELRSREYHLFVFLHGHYRFWP